MPKTRFYFIALVLLTLGLSSCGLLQEKAKPEVDLTEIFPDDLPAVGQVQRLDVDEDDRKEWLVFYHVDLVQDNKEGSPIAAAVYQPVADQDSRLPPHLVPTLVWLPRQGYPCFHTCEAEMRDVISAGPKGRELIIKDRLDGDTVGVAILRWQAIPTTGADDGSQDMPPGSFVPLGHFRADSIQIEKDRVTLIHKLGDRSDLATREVYVAQDGHYYITPASSVDDSGGRLRSPQEAEVIFALGPPKEPAQVKLPEKLVVAFYQNYRDLDKIRSYVSAIAGNMVADGCPAGTCGCSSDWKDVSRALIKQIAYETEEKPIISIVVQILCIDKNNQPDPMHTVTWRAQRQVDNTWQLVDVFPGGDEYLCSGAGCNWK